MKGPQIKKSGLNQKSAKKKKKIIFLIQPSAAITVECH